MFPLSLSFLKFAAAGALIALSAAIHSPYAETLLAPTSPVGTDEMVQNLGPVRPHDPILTAFGSKRVIAFYEPSDGSCAVHVVVWNPTDVNAESTVSFKATVNPRQMTHIYTAEHESLHLQCGDNAERLALVDTDTAIRAIDTDQQVASKLVERLSR